MHVFTLFSSTDTQILPHSLGGREPEGKPQSRPGVVPLTPRPPSALGPLEPWSGSSFTQIQADFNSQKSPAVSYKMSDWG